MRKVDIVGSILKSQIGKLNEADGIKCKFFVVRINDLVKQENFDSKESVVKMISKILNIPVISDSMILKCMDDGKIPKQDLEEIRMQAFYIMNVLSIPFIFI